MKNQIHRYQSTGPVECEKESDPTLEVGTENDEHSTAITLAIVLTAFIISPMTECLGPVLELNVISNKLNFVYSSMKDIDFCIRHLTGTVGRHSTCIHSTGSGLHPNGTALIVQSREIAGRRIGGVWHSCYIGRCGRLVAQSGRWLSIEFRFRLLQKLRERSNVQCVSWCQENSTKCDISKGHGTIKWISRFSGRIYGKREIVDGFVCVEFYWTNIYDQTNVISAE